MMKFPEDIEEFRKKILKIIYPISPTNKKKFNEVDFFHIGERTEAGRNLPRYYLVFFLFVDLLKFNYSGPDEKVAWTIPIIYNEKTFLLQYRKMGLGLFAKDAEKNEKHAVEIVKRINKAIKKAEPFYDYIASKAVEKSEISVTNNSSWLFERYEFFYDEYKKYKNRALKSDKLYDYHNEKKASWNALSAIEAFFSWTEHVFLHIAILKGNIQSNEDLIKFIKDFNWKEEYEVAIGLSDVESQKFFTKLNKIRIQLRNHYTHGAIGKMGQSLVFHSKTGAVPVQINQVGKKKEFSLGNFNEFQEDYIFEIIELFLEFMWMDDLLPAKIYIMDSDLITIIPFAKDGTYADAMKSTEKMKSLIDKLVHVQDASADMDWFMI